MEAKIELKGRQRENALERAELKIRHWGLKMPRSFAPLVLHFGLDNFSKIGHIEYWVVNDEKEKYCGKFIFMFSGQTCPEHYHKKKHETFMVLRGEILMHLKERGIRMKQGDVLPMPQRTAHSFTAFGDSLILEVSLPSLRGDNYFKDERIAMI